MLKRIVKIIESSTFNYEDGTLFCHNYVVNDVACLDFIENKLLENTITTKQIGKKIDLEFNLAWLNSFGYYQDCETFVLKNRYNSPSDLYYIEELKCYSIDYHEFIKKYEHVINLINSIKNIAKHNYTDTDIDNSIIFREDKSVFLPFEFDSSDIKLINGSLLDKLNSISTTFFEKDSEKKLLFINELIEFTIPIHEAKRFKTLLSHFDDFYDKGNNAYQFYLRDYSYNKLKIELDSKALEYTQKIQSVINDSQTKLIAIPTAFVLVFTVFDFTDLFEIKNIASMLSLIIFAILIQLFLNNQKSTLRFIRGNILSYKETFNNNDIEQISSKFSLVEKELKKQRYRLSIVEVLLWLIPISLFCLWLLLIDLKFVSLIIGISFIIIVTILNFLIKCN